MDQKPRPNTSRALLIAIPFIILLCLAMTLVPGTYSANAGSKHLFWLQCFIIFSMLIGTGAIVWYEQKRRQSLQNELAKQSRALKKSEEKYRSLVESAEDFIFTVDESGRFQSLNNFTANFFGGTPSQFLGEPLSVLFSEEIASQQLKFIRMVFQFGKSVRDEFMVKTGEHHAWLSANFMPLKDERERVISVLCIARDITENKKLEGQLINTEKLASMGTLAAGVAHELNNPLGVILGFTDLLLEKFDKDSQDYQDLKTIERHGLHCKQVVENLLSFARQGEEASEYCDIHDAINEIIGVVRHSLEMNNVELRVELASSLPKVKGDLRQMQQVFLNLINNAAAAMKGGGILEIKTALDEKQGKVYVTVRDNGHGIKEEHMENIFDPFFTTKSEGEGTGLGLFVSHGIIMKYEGAITCESSTEDRPQRPRGTTFTVMLRAKEGNSV
ncbi:MAG: PAS domain S-box protein [Deltaproteobacteria bacterium]|nr:PAS domain S-box protein [Deltaproteobacteria bacterium]MBW2019085.1 PAS domain S-box protein [Deltaproteobacteria bacterium]MBW2073524.1 PAS domain S-box protein [Deltaproteobacteria bacterium]